MKGRYVPSLLAAIGEILEEHMISIGFMKAPGTLDEDDLIAMPQVVNLPDSLNSPETSDASEAPAQPDKRFRQCPKCGQASLIRQENCDTCTSCTYSKCG